MRIDFHCHIFYKHITPEFMKTQFKAFVGYSFYNRILQESEKIEPVNLEDPIEKTSIFAKRVKLDKIVLLSVSKNENERIKDWIKAKPDLFVPFFNPPEKLENKNEMYEIVEKAINEEGFKGLKIMLPFRGKKLNSKNLFPAYEIANKEKIPVLFHTGYPPPGTPGRRIKMSDANPVFIDSVVASFPTLKIVLAHMGYPWIDTAISLACVFPNIYLDISNMIYMLPERLKDALLYAMDIIGMDKILYGSDGFCPEFIEFCAKRFLDLDYLTKKELEKIMGLNAKKVLNLK
ncbi:MAG: amidohydrolase family protein [Candidatus Helarchaeota archaeon]